MEEAKSVPEDAGVASSGVIGFLDAIRDSGQDLHGLVILRHGKLVAEGWWHPYSPDIRHALFSVSKSFTSLAAGFAIGEGKASLDDAVVSFFPDEAPRNASLGLRQMRLRHLLTMTTGHDQDFIRELARKRDWVKAFLIKAPEHEPGSHFTYNNLASYMVSAIVQQVVGMDILEYLKPRLFSPLGIANPAWERCPLGRCIGAWGLSLSTREVSRFGQFLLQKGQWEGRQLLPAAWVEQATSLQVRNGDKPDSDRSQGYGFQFWRCRHGAYRADGAAGQFCIVMPEQDMVVAIHSGASDMQALMDLVWAHLLPAASGLAKLPANPEPAILLAQKLSELRHDPPASVLTAQECLAGYADWLGKVWVFAESNKPGIKRIGFGGTAKKPVLLISDGRGRHRLRFDWA